MIKTRATINRLGKTILFWIFIILVVASCSLHDSERDLDSVYPTTLPISEYIIGRWETEATFDDSYAYEVEFLTTNTVKFIVLTEHKRLVDGTTSDYYFVSADSIFVDNLRIIGGEEWKLVRDGQELLVYRTVFNNTTLFRFTRISD